MGEGVGTGLYLPGDLEPLLPFLHFSTPFYPFRPSSQNPVLSWVILVRCCFGAMDVREDAKAKRRLAEFKTPINSYSYFDFDTAFYTAFLKSCKYLYTLRVYIRISIYFYDDLFRSVGLAISSFHSRVADISFYVKIPRRF
jgi:hypothetical protein